MAEKADRLHRMSETQAEGMHCRPVFFFPPPPAESTQCVFRGDGLACVRCTKRYPPVECVMSPVGWVDDSRSRRSESAGSLQLVAPWQGHREPAPSHSPASEGPSRETLDRLLWRESIELQPIASEEWLRVDAGNAKGKLVSSFGRSGTNLILDGSGDPSALRPFGGILTEINTINSLAPHHSARNVELLHFCKSVLWFIKEAIPESFAECHVICNDDFSLDAQLRLTSGTISPCRSPLCSAQPGVY